MGEPLHTNTWAAPSEPLNPPAFPSGDFEAFEPSRGMTLRDWFAGQAMASMLTGAVGIVGGSLGAYAHGACNAVIVDRAYVIADAMLAERMKAASK
jgi:hypothetical protein